MLGDFKKLGVSEDAAKGADRLERAVRGKVPRGRHRATFCMALEIAVAGPTSATAIIEKFGVPRSPRVWVPFTKEQKSTLMSILDEYASDGSAAATVAITAAPAEEDGAASVAATTLACPASAPMGPNWRFE